MNRADVIATEYGQCGSLAWTVEKWGRVTHKHGCPNRTDPWCQSHPAGCDALAAQHRRSLAEDDPNIQHENPELKGY